MPDKLLSVGKVARRLDVSYDTVVRYFDKGLLEGVAMPNRFRRTIRIYETSLANLKPIKLDNDDI